MVRHLCFGWNHPQFAYALVTLASILAAIGNDFESELMMRRHVRISESCVDCVSLCDEIFTGFFGRILEAIRVCCLSMIAK